MSKIHELSRKYDYVTNDRDELQTDLDKLSTKYHDAARECAGILKKYNERAEDIDNKQNDNLQANINKIKTELKTENDLLVNARTMIDLSNNKLKKDREEFSKEQRESCRLVVQLQNDLEETKKLNNSLEHRIQMLGIEFKESKDTKETNDAHNKIAYESLTKKYSILETTYNKVVQENEKLKSVLPRLKHVVKEAKFGVNESG